MKSATLTNINNEQEGHTSKSSLPSLSYTRALDLVIILPGGAIRTVRSCSVEEMRALVQSCVATATKKGCAAAVAGLDYREMLDRWYAILELREHGCTLPIAKAASAETVKAIR